MNNTEKMIELLRRVKKQMNGAVTDSMRERGLDYSLNYGVSAVTLKQIAAGFAPDHEFARFLYRQDVRELKLSAFYIADPAKVTESELDFWATGVVNSEVAQYLAFVLMGRSDIASIAVRRWITSDSVPLRYAGLMTLVRMAVLGRETPKDIDEELVAVVSGSEKLLWNASASLAARLTDEENRYPTFIKTVKECDCEGAVFVRNELGLTDEP